MSTSNTTSTTDFETFLLFLCGAVELLIHFVGIPLSIANLILVARTSVIHPNMKFILVFQSFAVLLRGFCRFVICLFKFILWDPISAEMGLFFPAILKIGYFGIYSRNYVPHILIIERILATVFVRTYEQHRGFLFTIIWLPFALTISVYIAFTSQAESVPPLANLLTTFVEFVIGTVEMAIFYQLSLYNIKIYQKMLRNNEGNTTHNNLSVRYQLSENIRIGKQLIPPLFLYLCNIFAGLTILSWGYFGLPYFFLVLDLLFVMNSLIGLFIELFIITCHPFLKRDFYQFLNRFGEVFGRCWRPFFHRNRRIGDQTATNAAVCTAPHGTVASPPAVSVGIAQRDLISGKALIDQFKSDEHFAMLNQAWEMKSNKSAK